MNHETNNMKTIIIKQTAEYGGPAIIVLGTRRWTTIILSWTKSQEHPGVHEIFSLNVSIRQDGRETDAGAPLGRDLEHLGPDEILFPHTPT